VPTLIVKGYGYDKRVDFQNQASTDHNTDIFCDPSRREMMPRSRVTVVNPQTAIKTNRTNEIHCAGIPNAIL